MRGLLLPAVLLGAVVAFSLWNGCAIASDVDRWQGQLDRVDALALAEDWAGAASALADSHADWSARQTYLHTVSLHSALDGAESLYRRCMVLAEVRELPELRASLAELRQQLTDLAEMERIDIRNIL